MKDFRRSVKGQGLTGRELPEVEVTGVERSATVPAGAQATGFTVAVTNDFATRRSALAVDSDLLLGTADGYLLAAATLFGAAEHLLETGDRDTTERPRRTGSPGSGRRRSRGRNRRRR